jgi:hypothetical protein
MSAVRAGTSAEFVAFKATFPPVLRDRQRDVIDSAVEKLRMLRAADLTLAVRGFSDSLAMGRDPNSLNHAPESPQTDSLEQLGVFVAPLESAILAGL